MYELKMSKNDNSPDILLDNFANKPSMDNSSKKYMHIFERWLNYKIIKQNVRRDLIFSP